MILSQPITVRIRGEWKAAKFIRYTGIDEVRVFVFSISDYMFVKLDDVKE